MNEKVQAGEGGRRAGLVAGVEKENGKWRMGNTYIND